MWRKGKMDKVNVGKTSTMTTNKINNFDFI